jgi:hypothetical protein
MEPRAVSLSKEEIQQLALDKLQAVDLDGNVCRAASEVYSAMSGSGAANGGRRGRCRSGVSKAWGINIRALATRLVGHAASGGRRAARLG